MKYAKLEPINDTEFEDVIIKKVVGHKDSWEIETESGWIGFSRKSGVIPHSGDTARFYGKGFGYPVRGIFINGQRVYYKTFEQENIAHERWSKAWKLKKERTFKRNKAKMDADYKALPPVFKKRIDRFRSNAPDFRVDHEAYEMSSCIDAVKIAQKLKTVDALKRWRELDYKKQNEEVPGLFDGHSGNTFGMACRLAYWYLAEPENVWREHAAISALVGCEEAGCPPSPAADEKREGR